MSFIVQLLKGFKDDFNRPVVMSESFDVPAMPDAPPAEAEPREAADAADAAAAEPVSTGR